MNLAFATHWKPSMNQFAGQPTHFVEKIMHSFSHLPEPHFSQWADATFKAEDAGYYDPSYAETLEGTKGKIHTLRMDGSDRWHPGKNIHFVINQRTPQQFNFAPVTPCTNTEKVYMSYEHNDIINITVGDVTLFGYEERLAFAKNDGFDTWDQFFEWFYPAIQKTKDNWLEMKLVQWTDYRYE